MFYQLLNIISFMVVLLFLFLYIKNNSGNLFSPLFLIITIIIIPVFVYNSIYSYFVSRSKRNVIELIFILIGAGKKFLRTPIYILMITMQNTLLDSLI